MKQIVKIVYGGHLTSVGEEYTVVEVGRDDVTEIKEHQCGVPGDLWYYDVIKENGDMMRIFSPNYVYFRQENDGQLSTVKKYLRGMKTIKSRLQQGDEYSPAPQNMLREQK